MPMPSPSQKPAATSPLTSAALAPAAVAAPVTTTMPVRVASVSSPRSTRSSGSTQGTQVVINTDTNTVQMGKQGFQPSAQPVPQQAQQREVQQPAEEGQALREINDKVDDLVKKLSEKEATPAPVQVPSAAEAMIRHLNARVDGLSDKLKEMESKSANDTARTKASDLPSAGQVQLVNAKADTQQAILTASLDGRAKIQGKVDASDHARGEVLDAFDSSLEGAMAKARAGLEDAEEKVAETARQTVDGTLAHVLKMSMDKVIGVGMAADSLKSEAETLQSNATAVKDQVTADAALGHEAVDGLPSSSALVEQRLAQIQDEVQDMSQEARGAETLADSSLQAVEEALKVVNHSASKARQARALRGRAAEQVALNSKRLHEIRQALTGASM
ncbi:for [Symbiodinium pilosum]|uniref:For protein n=1 Tax=Symbiodinium pilosum TaxID=2952 RepID=A0A812Q9T1_SYMPI|nr:for [Symbiodinium pilosum]